MTPRNKLNNPYYFVKDGVIFRINVTNDEKDPCGKHYVSYVLDPESSVNPGQQYINVNGDYVIATTDATGVVSTGKVDEATSASKFPYFKITDTNGNDHYLWLDNFIRTGDVYKSNKFKKTVHTEEGESTAVDFAQDYVNSVKRAIATAMVGGTSFNAAKASYPSYLFAVANDEITINGKTVTIAANGVKASYSISSLPVIKESDVQTEIMAVVNDKVIDYANGLLMNVDKKVKSDVTTLLTDINTEAL